MTSGLSVDMKVTGKPQYINVARLSKSGPALRHSYSTRDEAQVLLYKFAHCYTAKRPVIAGAGWLEISGSSIEEYRAGRIARLPYDLCDPIDHSICVALQLYVDYLERLASEDRNRDTPAYEGGGNSPSMERSTAQLEKYMCSLRDDSAGTLTLSSEQRYIRARDVLRCLFGPARAEDGSPLPMDSGQYEVPREVWTAGLQARANSEEAEPQDDEEQNGSSPASLARDVPCRFPQRMTPLIALVQQALGPLVSQSEAARRLGLTPRGITIRIARGKLRNVEVEARVLVLEEDLQ